MDSRTQSIPNLSSLQAGRGIAAVLVVLFHTTVMFAAPKYWGTVILGDAFRFGFAGVEFFFVLSGFIMMHVHRRDIGRSERLRAYLEKRAARIYPIYWIVSLAFMAMAVTVNSVRWADVLNTPFLIGPNSVALLGVAWTLFHEVLFYLLFAGLILHRRVGWSVLAIWFVLCTLWFGRAPPHYALSSINLLFGFGITAALLLGRTPVPRFVLCLGVTAFIAVGIETVWLNILREPTRELAFGLAAAFAIAGVVKAEFSGSIRVPNWLSRLGDSSYALYLIHYPLLSVIAKVWMATPLRWIPAVVAFPIVVLLCVGAGYLLHIAVEKPLLQRLRRRRSGEGPQGAREAA